jgi:cell division protein ZapA (FtsZ GTPase activity inhibitor)
MDDKLSIRVNVAERFYPLKISRTDEEKIRKAARLINEKVLQYKQKYTDKDLQDFLAMAALQFVIRLIECEENTDVEPIREQIKDLEQELGEYIHNRTKSNSVL